MAVKFISFEMDTKTNHFSVTDRDIKEKAVKVGSVMYKGDKIIITQKLIDELQKVVNGDFENIK